MQSRKIGLLILALFTTSFAFGQSEALKVVVNNLAFYKQKGDLKFLSNAKKSADSLVVTRKDSADIEKNVYRIIVNSSILYTDSLNQLASRKRFLTKPLSCLISLPKRVKYINTSPKWITQSVVWQMFISEKGLP
jgi:hypothetical protein